MIHSIESGVVLPLLKRSRPRPSTASAARQFIASKCQPREIKTYNAGREFSSTASINADADGNANRSGTSKADLSSIDTTKPDIARSDSSAQSQSQSQSQSSKEASTPPTKPLKATDPGFKDHQSSWVNSIVSTARADLRNDHATRLSPPGSYTGAGTGNAIAGVGVSRDMSGSAESSRGAAMGWAKPATPSTSTSSTPPQPSPPQSISSRLTYSPFATPSPRRGVHARQRRAAGQTPKEAETFDAILAGIFANLESSTSTSSSFSNRSRTRTSPGGAGGGVVSDPYAAARGGGRAGVGAGFGLGRSTGVGDRARNLRRWFERDEVDDEVVEELEMLKEEMAVIGDDVELIEWAKNRVFKPLAPIDVSATRQTALNPADDQSKSNGDSATSNTAASPVPAPFLTFAPTYPKILAHLLRTLRVNYNSPHLVLSLFHYAQTSSLESYLSGCLTGAYNEVLTAKWESFRDFVGVENGIREMEVMGVNWDAATARLVSRIVEEVSRDLLPFVNESESGSAGVNRLGMAGLDFSDPNGAEDSTSGFKNLSTMMGGGSGAGGSAYSKSNLNWKYGGLLSITAGSFGSGVGGANDMLERLGRLEKKVQKDVKMQEKMYENMQRKKRRARDERERRLERESQEGAYDGAVA
ncbi:hypothetical protein I316_04908 [Kwoniella heveanensis BCC8398]|uniref:Mtf2-like C-terminal domain-containing protein n=1 Tax=Kwoniella heveanensis BCC8398 TaxID=1296120 RepID=A0A1B9GR73_9TREE|nr:hypothetical protein I316_04908 [Kwoniella heveanensis BCC8398]